MVITLSLAVFRISQQTLTSISNSTGNKFNVTNQGLLKTGINIRIHDPSLSVSLSQQWREGGTLRGDLGGVGARACAMVVACLHKDGVGGVGVNGHQVGAPHTVVLLQQTHHLYSGYVKKITNSIQSFSLHPTFVCRETSFVKVKWLHYKFPYN